MEIKKEYSFEDLKDMVWSGAVDTLETIEEKGKEEELMQLLEENFSDIPTDTEVNDFLWFEDDYIFEQLGINEDEDEDDEDEDDDEEEEEEE